MALRVRQLVLACHPLPTAAVTAMAAGLGALAGLPFGTWVLMVGAVFTGQLSIGWCNDAVDAERDRIAGRPDKPVAGGRISRTGVAVASTVALVVSALLSVALGLLPGLVALTVVACGWAYNLGLKRTWLSFLPYAVAFGLLPAVATLPLPGHPWPAGWAVLAGALLGVSAHLLNVLPDLEDDARTGVAGLPHRLGRRATAVLGPVLLLVASAVIISGPPGRPPPWMWAAAAGLAGVAAVGVLVGLRGAHLRPLFVVAIVVALADLALFAISGASIVG